MRLSTKPTTIGLVLVIWRRNRFQGTSSKVPEPVTKPGTRNRFLNIVLLMHCIICVLYESLFVNNESRNIGLEVMRLSFHFTHSFIYSFNCFIAILCSCVLKVVLAIVETIYGCFVLFRKPSRMICDFVPPPGGYISPGDCPSVCLFVRKIT